MVHDSDSGFVHKQGITVNRYAALSTEHDELVEAREEAQNDLFDAIGTRKEGDAQGAFARADAALSAWLDSEEGLEWARLDADATGKAA